MPDLPILEVAASDTLDGAIHVRLTGETELDASATTQIKRCLEIFVEAGKLGGYCVEHGQPDRSSLTFRRATRPSRNSASVTLDAKAVTKRCFQLLRHMLARPEQVSWNVQRIDVQDGSAATPERVPEIGDDSEEALYPPMIAHPSFELASGIDEFSKWRRLEVEFADAIGAEQVLGLKPYLEPWSALLNNGAFALPYALPFEVTSVAGQITQFDSHTAEFEVPVYLASEEGWNVLVNLLQRFSTREWNIVRITLD
jgi:hypothetical protein